MKNYPPIILSKFKQKINRERTPKNLLSSLNFLPCSDIIFQTVDIIFLVFIISQQTHTQGQGLKNCKTIEKKRAHLLHNYKKISIFTFDEYVCMMGTQKKKSSHYY